MSNIVLLDPLSLVIVILALATISLAYFTFQTVRQGEKQTDVIRTQNMILRSQIDPIPFIKEFSFKNNSLDLIIENIGGGPASSLAIETSFMPAKRVFFETENSIKPISESEIIDRIQEMKQVSIRYEIEEKLIEENGIKYHPIRLVYPLLNRPRNSLVLFSKEKCSYLVELGFGLHNENNSSWLSPRYEDFVNLIRSNGVTCFILGFKLLCKNMAEDTIPEQSVALFIVDLTRHSNIEEAYVENTTPPMTVGLLDLAIRGIPIERKLYVNSKSETYFTKKH